jgi:hypothetical protein
MSVGRELQGVIQPISQNFGKPLPQASVNKGKKREATVFEVKGKGSEVTSKEYGV